MRERCLVILLAWKAQGRGVEGWWLSLEIRWNYDDFWLAFWGKSRPQTKNEWRHTCLFFHRRVDSICSVFSQAALTLVSVLSLVFHSVPSRGTMQSLGRACTKTGLRACLRHRNAALARGMPAAVTARAPRLISQGEFVIASGLMKPKMMPPVLRAHEIMRARDDLSTMLLWTCCVVFFFFSYRRVHYSHAQTTTVSRYSQ